MATKNNHSLRVLQLEGFLVHEDEELCDTTPLTTVSIGHSVGNRQLNQTVEMGLLKPKCED